MPRGKRKASPTTAKPKAKAVLKATPRKKAASDSGSDFELSALVSDESASDFSTEAARTDEDEDTVMEEVSSVESEEIKLSKGGKKGGARKPVVKKADRKELPSGIEVKDANLAAEDLPPLANVQLIFKDIVRRVPAIKELGKHLGSRKLRVGTMCSGTESPLLALGMITRSMKEIYGITVEVDHLFSCEIEPFKQAYIERNFRPPILFRDITELGADEA
jgi:hypothetical protein